MFVLLVPYPCAANEPDSHSSLISLHVSSFQPSLLDSSGLDSWTLHIHSYCADRSQTALEYHGFFISATLVSQLEDPARAGIELIIIHLLTFTPYAWIMYLKLQ